MRKYISKRILIASDSPLRGLSIEGFLGAAGYRYVRATSDVREIMRLYAKWPFALLILDIDMSLQNHTQIFEDLAEHVARDRLSVLAVTHENGLAPYARALHAGILDVFTRPFTRVGMLTRVSDALAVLPDSCKVAISRHSFSVH